MYFSLTPDIIYDTKPVSYPFSESDKTIAKNFFRRYEINEDVYGYATYYNKYAVKEGAKIEDIAEGYYGDVKYCLLYTSPSPRDRGCSRMRSSA